MAFRTRTTRTGFLATSIALAVIAATWASRPRASGPPGPAPVAGTRTVRELVSAVPFTVRDSFVHTWRKEAPSVRAGYLCVFAVDPAIVEPRQTAEPVLFVGGETAERVNHGAQSGRVIAIVPCAVDDHGAPSLDLEHAPVWFGEPDLPERIDAAAIATARALAARSDRVTHFDHAQVAAALARGGARLDLDSRVDLEQSAALLILEHSPAEFDLADGLLRSKPR